MLHIPSLLKYKLVISSSLFCLKTFSQQEGRFEFHSFGWENRIIQERVLDTVINAHTSVWPQRRSSFNLNASDYQDIYQINKDIKWKRLEWARSRVFNSDLYFLDTEDFKLHINAALNLETGLDRYSDHFIFLNTRGIALEGKIGKRLTFISTFYESQGRFANYQQSYFEEKRSVFGWAPWRRYNDDAYDFPFATGQISFTASKYFNISLGHGNHFLGEGYRSMLFSDYAIPYGFVRLETDVWKIKYVNLFTLMNDNNPDFIINGVKPRKFAAIHYLSYNVTPKWNISLFESFIMGADTGNAATFDLNFLNPVILYRVIEANSGFRTGNIMMGLNSSYKLTKGLKIYGQLAIDDFKLSAFRQIRQGHWLNFFAYQVGAKYADAFGIRGLFLLGEYNVARPFMYSHRSSLTNYSSLGLPLAHPWETNFRELIFRVNYLYNRFEISNNLVIGQRGIDDGTENWGNNIALSYQNRASNLGFFIAGPESKNVIQNHFCIGYIVNPISNTRIEIGYLLRNESTSVELQNHPIRNADMITFGVRTAMFNRYNDF